MQLGINPVQLLGNKAPTINVFPYLYASTLIVDVLFPSHENHYIISYFYIDST